MKRFPLSRRGAAAAVAAIAVALACAPALRQGFDLQVQGGPLLAARLLLEGTPVGGPTTPFADAVLAAWFLLVGANMGALALLHTLALGLMAGAGTWLSWPRAGAAGALAFSWATIAVAAVPAGPLLALAVALAGAALSSLTPRSSLQPLIAGGAWLLAAALDLRIGLAVAPLALVAARGAGPREPASGRRLLVGAAIAVAGVLLAGGFTAGLPATAMRGIVAPLRELGMHLTNGELLRFVRTALAGAWIEQPFGGWPPTGETLAAAWPGHGLLRGLALRSLVLVPLVLLLWKARAAVAGRQQAVLVAAACACALLSLALRGDGNGLRLVALPVTVALVLGWSGRAWVGAVLAIALTLPLGAETAWRSLHADRAPLVTWENPRGGVRVTEARASRWTEIRRELVPRAGEPALIQPANPGLHWILGTTPLTADQGPTGDVESDRRVARGLVETSPRLVLLGQDPSVLGHRLLERAPRTWAALRDGYRVAGLVRLPPQDFRLLLPDSRGEPGSLAERLPQVELTVAGELTPALREGLLVGQSFRLGARDLEGFAVRARTRGRDLPVELRIQVWQRRANGFDTALFSQRVNTTIAGDGSVLWFRLPVPDTAFRELAITLELRGEVAEEIRLDWYVHDEAHEEDFYAEGDALLGLEAVAADLYFLAY